MSGNGERRDPLAGVTITPALIQKPGVNGRQTAVRPAEKRRKLRQMLVTFSSPDIPGRIRALALRWGMTTPDRDEGVRPNVSALVEHLLLSQLEEAEAGEIPPPGEGA